MLLLELIRGATADENAGEGGNKVGSQFVAQLVYQTGYATHGIFFHLRVRQSINLMK